MIWYVRGKVAQSFPQYVVVDVMGIGLQVHLPASSYFNLPRAGEDIFLYTYLLPKEDSFTLYGFLQPQERDFFVTLLGVGGIGPKAALSLLGHLTIPQIVWSVTHDELSALTTIPGIGKKTASRICYELKQKLDATALQAYAGAGDPLPEDFWLEVAQALTALGYSESEISRVRLKVSTEEETSVEHLFKKALAHLSRE